MPEQYRLLYSAEVIEGQHAAVVKKRLQAMLKLDDERMNVLFSGKAVVVKKATDKKTAVRYEEAFKKVGAKLRVEALQAVDEPQPASQTQPDAVADPLDVLPSGTDLLAPEERNAPADANIDTSHLSVQLSEQGANFDADQAAAPIQGPNVDHLSLADPGTALGVEGVASADQDIEILDIDFDLAEIGTPLGDEHPPPPAAIDVDAVDFDVAETGAALDTSKKPVPPQAPDTSHLKLSDN